GILVHNAAVVEQGICQDREKYPDRQALASSIRTRHVAIGLSAGTLCHCAVFLPMRFGAENTMSTDLGPLAVTISGSLLASWLVAISVIPMLSARMKTPPAVKSPLITGLQERYARTLRWSLQHRGWSVAGIVLITMASIVPITQSKGSGDDRSPDE